MGRLEDSEGTCGGVLVMKWRLIFFWVKVMAYAKKKAEELLIGSLICLSDTDLFVGRDLMKYAKLWGQEVMFSEGEDKSHFDAYIERKGVKLIDFGINITQRSAYEVHNREVRHGRS